VLVRQTEACCWDGPYALPALAAAVGGLLVHSAIGHREDIRRSRTGDCRVGKLKDCRLTEVSHQHVLFTTISTVHWNVLSAFHASMLLIHSAVNGQLTIDMNNWYNLVMDTLTVGIYGRVSTKDQSVDLQVSELTAYASRMGWTIAATYLDAGISGAKDKRPGLDKLMEDARVRRFDAVLVWKLDRFGRSLPALVDNVRKLDEYGVRFVSLTESIDTDSTSPVGRLMLHLFAAFAEFERGLIVERVKAGVAEAQRQGKHCGRPARVFRRDEAIRLRQEGQSLRQIAKTLGVPFSTIADAVRKVATEERIADTASKDVAVA